MFPAHVAVNSKGEIIVPACHIRRVFIYHKSGAYSRDLLMGRWDRPGGSAVERDDTLYIVNGKTGTIKVINKDGQELRTIQYGDCNKFYFGVYCITFIIRYKQCVDPAHMQAPIVSHQINRAAYILRLEIKII